MIKTGRMPGQKNISTIWWLAARIRDYPYKDPDRYGDRDDPLDVSPPFQRGAVWTKQQSVYFVRSLLSGLPMPAIFTNRYPIGGVMDQKDHAEIVIDGKQRLLAVAAFMNDELEIDGELFSQQTDVFKRGFKTNFSVPHIVCEFKTERECVELYVQLLRTGTAHTEDEIQKAEAMLK